MTYLLVLAGMISSLLVPGVAIMAITNGALSGGTETPPSALETTVTNDDPPLRKNNDASKDQKSVPDISDPGAWDGYTLVSYSLRLSKLMEKANDDSILLAFTPSAEIAAEARTMERRLSRWLRVTDPVPGLVRRYAQSAHRVAARLAELAENPTIDAAERLNNEIATRNRIGARLADVGEF